MRVEKRIADFPSWALAWRALGLFALGAVWLREGSKGEGLLVILCLAIAALARWRFPRLPPWSLLFDQAICGLGFALWPGALYGFSLPLFDSFSLGAAWLALPLLAATTLAGGWSLSLALAFAVAALAGHGLRRWSEDLGGAIEAADRDRGERYALEDLKADLVAASVRSARLAELAERSRIARDLHDHAGHELTAAHLALQAHAVLVERGGEGAEALLAEARARVEKGLETLRERLRGIAPTRGTGLEILEDICRRLPSRPVELEVHGNTERIPPHVWGVLEPCLKEALSNCARHGEGGKIEAKLDVGPRIARLAVRAAIREAGEEGGGEAPFSEGPAMVEAREAKVEIGEGLGLRNLRQRARAIGGSLSVDLRAGFLLVCVLPVDDGGEGAS